MLTQRWFIAERANAFEQDDIRSIESFPFVQTASPV